MVRLSDGAERPAIFTEHEVQLLDERLPDLRAWLQLSVEARQAAVTTQHVPLTNVQILAPVRPPKNVFCVGRNYLAHAEESTRAHGIKLDLPDVPTFFSKAPTSIVDPDHILKLDADVSTKYDWEAELGVVIGQRCKNISEADALHAVFGYTAINDISARDVQQAHVQWFKGKSLDDTCPVGPWIVGADEITQPQNLRIALRVNGVSKQDGSTSQMIFSVARIIAELSRGMTLEPGDLIATGTPEGVGFARNPPEFLQDGDRIELEIESVGILRNVVSLRQYSAV